MVASIASFEGMAWYTSLYFLTKLRINLGDFPIKSFIVTSFIFNFPSSMAAIANFSKFIITLLIFWEV